MHYLMDNISLFQGLGVRRRNGPIKLGGLSWRGLDWPLLGEC